MGTHKVLVVDNDAEITSTLRGGLSHEGYKVATASGAEAVLVYLDDSDIDLVLIDLGIGGIDGLEVVQDMQLKRPETPIVLMTDFRGINMALEAIKAGTYHLVTKPIQLSAMLSLLQHALNTRDIQRENRQLRQIVEERDHFGQMLGKSAAMQRLFSVLERLAGTSSTVLIQGESGTGKELAARALHLNSPRHHWPFVPISCTAMPEEQLESELFGHVKGAFTGGQDVRKGLFLEATHGTIFLDEIGGMPVGIQAKLLRVLDQCEIRPVGSDREVQVDVRVVAATDREIEAEVERGRFREDLYDRLKAIRVRIPPLREHADDIAFFAATFLQRYTAAAKRGPRRFTREALRCLETYSWPGNVRQLSCVIERAVTLCDETWIDVEDVRLEEAQHVRTAGPSRGAPSANAFREGHWNLAEARQFLLMRALDKTRGHKTKAAALLGVHPRTLTRMMRRYHLPEHADDAGG
jgi:two-component system response regulator HydG